MSTAKKRDENGYHGLMVGPAVEPTPRWIRVKFGGKTIADSKRALLHRQYGPGRLPAYYFPQEDVRMELLSQAPEATLDNGFSYQTVTLGDRSEEDAAWIYVHPPEALSALKGLVSFKWNAMDGWYEEEEEVFVHARDPYKRVDVMPSSRLVRVVIDGQIVAETSRPYLLFETSLPTRYYVPREDVNMALLRPSDLKTRCPYKGLASYWSVAVGERLVKNVVWSYPEPILENPKIKDLMCFYNEKVDLFVDGELQARPLSPWSA